MPLKKDMSGLPHGNPVEGRTPDEPELTMPLTKEWFRRYKEAGKDTLGYAVEGASHRASLAGRCVRQTQYELLQLEQSNPVTVADAYRFELGHQMHDEFQSIMVEAYDKVEVEKKLTYTIDEGVFGATHVDLMVQEDDGTWSIVEIKTVGGYKFKMGATKFRGAPEGPTFEQVTQLALETKACREAGYDVSRAKLVWLSMENVSSKIAEGSGLNGEFGRFCAEWTFDLAELEDLAEQELERVGRILKANAEGRLVERYLPIDGLYIEDPTNGRGFTKDAEGAITGGRDAWECAYCSHRLTCATHDDLTEFPVEISG